MQMHPWAWRRLPHLADGAALWLAATLLAALFFSARVPHLGLSLALTLLFALPCGVLLIRLQQRRDRREQAALRERATRLWAAAQLMRLPEADFAREMQRLYGADVIALQAYPHTAADAERLFEAVKGLRAPQVIALSAPLSESGKRFVREGIPCPMTVHDLAAITRDMALKPNEAALQAFLPEARRQLLRDRRRQRRTHPRDRWLRPMLAGAGLLLMAAATPLMRWYALWGVVCLGVGVVRWGKGRKRAKR